MTERDNVKQQTSEYRFRDWRPEIKLIDFIPGLGLVTAAERSRRKTGESLVEHYIKGRPTLKETATLGLDNWPKGTNEAADIRSILLTWRNAVFAAYHGVILLKTAEYVVSQYLL